MIRLSSLIKTFKIDLLARYAAQLLPSHRRALSAWESCRTRHAPKMVAECGECHEQALVPHSCGHRSCPHCQAHESQQWLERQLRKLVPTEYFLVTFTLPAEFRPIASRHQRVLYSLLFECSWETIKTFSLNDRQLQGIPGAVAVLHTHSRELNYHPHVHIVVPNGAIDPKHRLWRRKAKAKNGGLYLFNHKALAKVFRAKLLDAMAKAGLPFPKRHPEEWVVDCKAVGKGDKALTYLGRYLYRGVIQEKDIVSVKDGQVTFRYQESETKETCYTTLPGEDFLWLVLQHVLPKGFRRARNFGFLHPNSKRLLQALQITFGIDPNRSLGWARKRPSLTCRCCGGVMKIIQTRILPIMPSAVPTVVPS
jgi:hypothetical protein